jgi:crossover junction endodeoxyribonuclease RusA
MRVFLPYPPSLNKLWKPVARGKLVRSPAYRSWMNDAVWVVFLAVRDQGKIRGPYVLNVWLHPTSAQRLRDVDNFLKAPCDALVKGGAVEDDSLCQDLRVRWGSFDDPGVLLDIEPCPSQTSPADGNARSPSGNEPESPRPTRRRIPRGATIQAVKSGGSSDTDSPGWRASGRPPSSTLAESIVLLKGLKNKPKT